MTTIADRPVSCRAKHCTNAGPIVQRSSTRYDLTVTAPADSRNGVRLLRVDSTGNGGEATSSTAAPLFVIDIGGPRMQIQRVVSAADPTPVTDGTPLSIKPGAASSAAFTVTKPIAVVNAYYMVPCRIIRF